MLTFFGYFMLFCLVCALIQFLFENPPILIGLLVIVVPLIIYSVIDDKRHPEKVLARKEEEKKKKHYKEIESTLLMMIKANQTLVVSDTIRLEGKGKNLNDIHLFYKDKELCLLSEYQRNQPQQYEHLLDRIHLLTSDLSANTLKQTTESVSYFTNELTKIKGYNVDIPDETISASLDECYQNLEKLQKLLFDYPQESDKIDKLQKHYLPILMDILDQYCKISKTSSDNDQTKDKLSKTIDLVNEAIQTIISSLFEKDHLSLNVNMDVLEDLLKKDGLVEDDLTSSMEEMYKKVRS